MVKYIKRFVCAFIWILLFPLRVGFVSLIFPLSLLIMPLWLIIELHGWACKDRIFGWNPLPFYKDLLWGVIVKGEFETFVERHMV